MTRLSMTRRQWLFGTSALMALTLVGCAPVIQPQDLRAGKFSITSKHVTWENGHRHVDEQSGSGTFRWEKWPDKDVLTLNGPLHTRLAELTITPKHVELQAQGKHYRSESSASELLGKVTQLPIPIEALEGWLFTPIKTDNPDYNDIRLRSDWTLDKVLRYPNGDLKRLDAQLRRPNGPNAFIDITLRVYCQPRSAL